MVDQMNQPLILVTGATGYIGGRLVSLLLGKGYRVRCLVRDPRRIEGREWAGAVEVVVGDLLQPETLVPALKDASVAYYLVHSLGAGSDFSERDIRAATNFSQAARAAGVERIIYLGGLAHPSQDLSEHLRSRHQTGDTLRTGGVPVTEFRAGVIVGSGSVSFELVRYLTERLPVMICPRWVYTRTQPIAIREVLAYLMGALTRPQSAGRIIEIGGSQVLTYGEMMTKYAEVRGLRRWMIAVPFLTPRLSSYWVNLVTPIPASIARPLIEGLRNENVVRDPVALTMFPEVKPVDYKTAVDRVLAKLKASDVETRWSDALGVSHGDVTPVALTNEKGMIREHRERIVNASPSEVYRAFLGLGGDRGWLYMNRAWEVRGFMDRMIGGVGLRRGRRHPDWLRVGDALDFWRVEAIEKDHLMRLRAEMKVPGKAWLQFEVTPHAGGGSLLSQTAFFASRGLAGWLYWYVLYPLHALIFSGMIRGVAARALEVRQQTSRSTDN